MPVFSAPLDLRQNELRNAVVQNLSTPPLAPLPGQWYYDTSTNLENYWNGTKWVSVSDIIDAANITGLGDLALLDQVGAAEIADGAISDVHISDTAAIALSKLAIDPLDRQNHTGTQLASTISDFDAQVRTNPLNTLAIPTGTVDMGGQIVTNVGDPVLPSDATNKAYVDGVASGLDIKDSARIALDTNIDLAAPGDPIDGVTMAAGDRILLMGQTNAAENGIYVWTDAATALTRSADADASGEVNAGMFCFVEEGSNADKGFVLTTDNPITVDTTPLAFTQFSGSGSVVGTPDRILVTGNQVDIDPNYAGQASITDVGTVTTGTWQANVIDVAYGGTGAATPIGARLNLGATGKFYATFGDGTSTSYTLDHNLNTFDVVVEIYETATKQTIYADISRPSANQVKIEGFRATDIPDPGEYTVVVVG